MGALLFLAPAPAPGFSLANGDVGWDGPGPGQATLTYYLVRGTEDLDNEEEVLRLALDEWSSVAGLEFIEADESGLPDSIDFDFGLTRPSPHRFTSDGVGGTLAFAFFPDDQNPNPLAGDVTFDEAETWTWSGAPGAGPGTCTAVSCDLYQVALHAVGHALGLVHSDVSGDPPPVMATDFSTPRARTDGEGIYGTLHPDDVAGIRAIYGPSPIPIPEATPGPLLLVGLAGVCLAYRASGSRKIFPRLRD